MSIPEFGKITFIKKPVTRLLTKPGNKVHVKFNVQTRPRYSASNYWDACTSNCCHCDNKSNTWFGIGALIGAVGGILAKIFGGKKQAQQVVSPDNTRQQYVPPKQNNDPVNPVKENEIKEEKPEEKPEVKPEEKPKAPVKPQTRKSTGGSPSGWYRATADQNSAISNISIEELEQAEAGDGKTQKSAAKYVLDKVLGSKLQQLNPNQRAQLLNEIIKKNPSVFDGRGRLKKDADISKLDIPSKAWIENDGYKGIDGVKIYQKNTDGTNGVVINREAKGQRTIMGNNGYYAVITTDKNGKKSAKFYAPSDNAEIYNKETEKMEKSNGRDITGPSFKNHCPNIYDQVMTELNKKP